MKPSNAMGAQQRTPESALRAPAGLVTGRLHQPRPTRDRQTKPRDIHRLERRAVAVNLRTAGHSFRAIAETLGVDVATAFHDVNLALDEARSAYRQRVEAFIELELARLDKLWTVTFDRALRGNLRATITCVAISRRRSRLLGLDKPRRVQHDVSRLSDDELQTLEALVEKAAGDDVR